ncbi:hypothetical protein HPB52_010223 [Rhipicephalus sanguineus]|uniref:Uncharacterized protein n=1 Tax=Rhipicephalus sanguineus TaxID=34632 RepID=A0A9D4SW00_RHISA|nr:hypothetical protein HPB52_010223 [Rhipicephalus sanguineus]
MLRLLRLPVKPFKPVYSRAWFIQLRAGVHAARCTRSCADGVKALPMMHAISLDALPVELRDLAAASTPSPLPYDDICAAMLSCYGKTYYQLSGSRDFQASPPLQRAVLTGLQHTLDHDLALSATTPSTLDPATGASISAFNHHDDVEDVPTQTNN